VSIFVALMLIVGLRVFPWLLWQVVRTGSRERFTLCVVAAAVSIAYASAQLFGVSFALGAFFAGMVLRESQFSHRAAEETLPLRDAFAVLFFVSVGMLFDPYILVEAPLQVVAVTAIVVGFKSLAAASFVVLTRYPLHTALTVSAGLAQIGEFSFILTHRDRRTQSRRGRSGAARTRKHRQGFCRRSGACAGDDRVRSREGGEGGIVAPAARTEQAVALSVLRD